MCVCVEIFTEAAKMYQAALPVLLHCLRECRVSSGGTILVLTKYIPPQQRQRREQPSPRRLQRARPTSVKKEA